MLNNMLASIFFRIDGIILRAIAGDRMLGWYGAAYKVVDGLNVIPSSFVISLFPMFARAGAAAAAGGGGQAPGRPDVPPARPDLYRGMVFGLRVLLAAAFPIAVGVTLLAEPIISLFAGPDFLPHAAITLQLLIWFIPFSFTNGLLQYVLISVNRQHFITVAFVAAAAFNIVGNLLLIPHWGYLGAAFMTVAAELVLLGPFLYAVRRYVGPLALLSLAWRPALAAALMAPTVWAVGGWSAFPAVFVGAATYAAALLLLGGTTREEIFLLRDALRRGSQLPGS
jgi:O-antigen/teichoic acid export membrane protein